MQTTAVQSFRNYSPSFTKLLSKPRHNIPSGAQLKSYVPITTSPSDTRSVVKTTDKLPDKIAANAKKIETDSYEIYDEVTGLFDTIKSMCKNKDGKNIEKEFKHDKLNHIIMEETCDGALIRRTTFADDYSPSKIEIFPDGDSKTSKTYCFEGEHGYLYDYTFRTQNDYTKSHTAIKQKYSYGENRLRYLESYIQDNVWIEKELVLENDKPINYRETTNRKYSAK